MNRPVKAILFFIALSHVEITVAQSGGESGNSNTLDSTQDEWSASEYSGNRTARDYQTAMLSKGFTWLSGSPADNEKLSIGKNAQFFGFVALRYQSGRAANRGVLGRAFFSIADETQRELLASAVIDEDAPLQEWWQTRNEILRLYENHLYTGQPIDEAQLAELSSQFSIAAADVAIREAEAFAALEDSLSVEQSEKIRQWRQDPELAREYSEGGRVSLDSLDPGQYAQLENLFAKAFSWLTGAEEDTRIIPLGQPAQFFGFVSIRHKSGHGANRGQIAKSFREILSNKQVGIIDSTIELQMPVVADFLQQRDLFLQQLSLLRTDPDSFDRDRTIAISELMGLLEIHAGLIEAHVYSAIRETMTDSQIEKMMALRSNYVLNENEVESLTIDERGEQLANLCFSCHGFPDQQRSTIIAPSLDKVFTRPIASVDNYEYSDALTNLGNGGQWTLEMMDQFIASPKTFAPGTKMEFQGLLNNDDRQALISYLQQVTE